MYKRSWLSSLPIAFIISFATYHPNIVMFFLPHSLFFCFWFLTLFVDINLKLIPLSADYKLPSIRSSFLALWLVLLLLLGCLCCSILYESFGQFVSIMIIESKRIFILTYIIVGLHAFDKAYDLIGYFTLLSRHMLFICIVNLISLYHTHLYII